MKADEKPIDPVTKAIATPEEDLTERHAGLLSMARSLVSEHKLAAFWPGERLEQKPVDEFTKEELDAAEGELLALIEALG